jgi:hypothetical protein
VFGVKFGEKGLEITTGKGPVEGLGCLLIVALEVEESEF